MLGTIRASLAPDIMERGPQLWSRGWGWSRHVAAFLVTQPNVRAVLNPCCGVGTFIAMVIACGPHLHKVTGLDNSQQRCQQAASLRLRLQQVVQFRRNQQPSCCPSPQQPWCETVGSCVRVSPARRGWHHAPFSAARQ